MRVLWPPQREALKACLNVLGQRPAYVQMPTGSGKSEIMRLIALEWLKHSSHKAIIVVPNQTLAFQHKKGFILYSKQVATLLLENFDLARSSRMIISTYASLHKILRHNRIFCPNTTLLLPDECHHCNASADSNRELIFKYPHRIGFSGTAWMNGTSTCFDECLVYALSLADAQTHGMLCEYDIKLSERLTPSSERNYQLYFVKDSSQFESKILNRSVYYDDDQSIYRPYRNRRLIEMFQFGQVGCLYVNRMLLEGFDCPEVKTIYIDKQSDSDILAMQMLGRGLRKLGSAKCNVYVSNERMFKTILRAIDRANTPIEEASRWRENNSR